MKRLIAVLITLITILSGCSSGESAPKEIAMGSLRITVEEVAQEPGTQENFIIIRGSIENTSIRDEVSPLINTYIADESAEDGRRDFSERVSTFPDTREFFLSKEDGAYPFELVFDYGDTFDVESVDVVIVGLSNESDETFTYDFKSEKFKDVE